MAYLGKTFTFSKHEKFDEFLKSMGTPQEYIDSLLAEKHTEKLVKNDDGTYTLTVDSGSNTFKSGVEFTENLRGTEAKSTIVANGDSFIQTQTLSNGTTITLKRDFSADKLVVTVSHSKWDGEAKRIYSA